MAQPARRRIINLRVSPNECEMKDFSARGGGERGASEASRSARRWSLTRDRNDTMPQACGGADGQAAPKRS